MALSAIRQRPRAATLREAAARAGLLNRTVRRLRPVLSVLLLATLVCLTMLVVRILITRDGSLTGLWFNLFLAWIPLTLSLFLRALGTQPGWRRRLFWITGIIWVLFYPNCFYIVTDLLHFESFGAAGLPQWFDMIMTMGFAFTGVFLGSLALYLLHLYVREKRTERVGWLFATMMLALASLGIYLGRYMRWNSWELFTHPSLLAAQVGRLLEISPTIAAFSLTFFAFSLIAYLFVVGMARLHEGNV